MKKVIYGILLIAVMFMLPKISFSQASEQYLLELKNGVSIKCYLVSISDNTIYAISDEGKKLTFDMSEVKSFNRILSDNRFQNEKYSDERFEGRRNDHEGEYDRERSREDEKENERDGEEHHGKEHRKNKLSFTIKGGSLIQLEGRGGRGDEPAFNATGIIDYEIRHFSVGVGFSVDGLTASRRGGSQIFAPVFADLKYNFRHLLGVTPFVFADGGYSIGSESAQGIMLSGGVGIKKRISRLLNLVVDAGFKYQEFRQENIFFVGEGDPGFPVDPGFNNRFRRSRSINSLNFNVGLQF